MNSIVWLEFQDIMRRFLWYQDTFQLLIYCKDVEEMELFIGEIDKWNIKWEYKKRLEKQYTLSKAPFQNIKVFVFDNDRINFCGVRANAIIFNDSFSFIDVRELILPLANVHPSYGCFYYDKEGLKTMFNYRGHYADSSEWNKYMLELEEEL